MLITYILSQIIELLLFNHLTWNLDINANMRWKPSFKNSLSFLINFLVLFGLFF